WRVSGEKGDTLAGLFFNTLGRAPRRGESVDISGYELVCVDVSGSRITRLRVVQKPEATEREATAEAESA
ncbi:MAG: magnesium/cobalt efflux protein, partial [bacterium]|nr:magnesium/cobalt efflux protein [bacterium]